jgi:hypothetical protein
MLVHKSQNPAHHSWNYLSGFERIEDSDLLENISTVIRPPTEYYGPLERLYPKLERVELLSLPEEPAIDPFPFSPTHVVLQLGGNYITRALKRRILRGALKEVPD